MKLLRLLGVLALMQVPALALADNTRPQSLPASPAGCSCREVPAAELMRSSSVAFQGIVVYPEKDQPDNITMFLPDVYYKGVELSRPFIANNRPDGAPACAMKFELNKSYEIFAYGTYETGYYTDACLAHEVTAGTPANRSRVDMLLRLRVDSAFDLMSHFVDTEKGGMIEIEKVRIKAQQQLLMNNPELAMRLYAHAAQMSRNSPVDLLGQGKAALKLMMATFALERFDDVLENDSANKEAWSGRYQALALLNRWAELPEEKANLSGLYLRRGAVRASLKAPVFAGGWWDEVDASDSAFPQADFTKMLLTDVLFVRANLDGADFTGTQMRNVDLRGANLKSAKLAGMHTQGVVWDAQTIWPDGFDPKSLNQ